REYKEAGPLMDRIVAIRKKAARDRPWLVRDAEVYQRYIKRVLALTRNEEELLHKSAEASYDAKQLERIGRTAEAIRLADESLATRKRLLGYADGVYLEELIYQAHRYLRMKQKQTGLGLLEEAVRMQRELKGELHRDHAASMQGLALAFEEVGELQKAEKLL